MVPDTCPDPVFTFSVHTVHIPPMIIMLLDDKDGVRTASPWSVSSRYVGGGRMSLNNSNALSYFSLRQWLRNGRAQITFTHRVGKSYFMPTPRIRLKMSYWLTGVDVLTGVWLEVFEVHWQLSASCHAQGSSDQTRK